ncbi:CbiX/SirB N-terminal domain-containing protein [Gorillibacterium sp. CAU 1737]|uniref:sirohydrochlorin chelatase n=1 Tax=Gorillibacterium sp. CAU 1737 TaxID=3140362 RepID=UPI0032618DF0
MSTYGVLIVSHGSRDSEWVRLVDTAVAGVPFPEGTPVSCCFLEQVEGRLIQDGVRELEAQGVTDLLVLPLFVSSGSSHVEEIAQAFGVRFVPDSLEEEEAEAEISAAADSSYARERIPSLALRSRVHMGQPLEEDAILAQIIYAKIEEQQADPTKEALLLVAHGSSDPRLERRYRRMIRKLAARLQAMAGYGEAKTALLLPDSEEVRRKVDRLSSKAPDRMVRVIPVFLSEGVFTHQVIPSRLAESHGQYAYMEGALLPSPMISVWLLEQFTQLLDKLVPG